MSYEIHYCEYCENNTHHEETGESSKSGELKEVVCCHCAKHTMVYNEGEE